MLKRRISGQVKTEGRHMCRGQRQSLTGADQKGEKLLRKGATDLCDQYLPPSGEVRGKDNLHRNGPDGGGEGLPAQKATPQPQKFASLRVVNRRVGELSRIRGRKSVVDKQYILVRISSRQMSRGGGVRLGGGGVGGGGGGGGMGGGGG